MAHTDNAELLAEAAQLRTMYHRWAGFDRDAVSREAYGELVCESTPRPGNDSPSALGMIAEASRRVLGLALGSADEGRWVWESCIENGEDVAYNVDLIRSAQFGQECPDCGTGRLVVDDNYTDTHAEMVLACSHFIRRAY